jgi:hypothetical protein
MADRKISDLTALTTPASGDFLPIVDISEAAAASKNKRITIEELFRGVPLGTAAAPSIAIEGDEDTGVFSPGANQLAVATNGVGRLFINNGGDIGVGTASPVSRLHVTGGDSVFGSGNLTRILNASQVIDFTNAAQDTYVAGRLNGLNLKFYTATGGGIDITSAGLVGIGVSSPESTLHCVGATVSEGDAAGQLVIRSSSAYNATPKSGIIFQILQDSSSNTAYVASIHAVKENTGDADRRTSLVFGTRAISGTTAERMRIDSSGNVGIGTASPLSPLVVSNGSNKNIEFQPGSTCYLFAYDRTASDYLNLDIVAENLIFSTSSERARIDSSGRLLVGTSSARAIGTQSLAIQNEGISFDTTGFSTCANRNDIYGPYIHLGKSRGTSVGSSTIVQSGDILGGIVFAGADGTDVNTQSGVITCEVDGTPSANDMPGRIVLSTTAGGAAYPTERMRIASGGNTDVFSDNDTLASRTSVAAGTTRSTFVGFHSATSTQNGTISCRIWSNGNVQNTNGSYTTLSDAKLKENIVDAGSQWDDLKAIQIRNWNFKAETGHETHRQIGPIAQELETVCPGLVFETPDRDADGNETGEVTKGVNQSVLYMKAVKALQEAMERIETLEANNTDLLARVTALESA